MNESIQKTRQRHGYLLGPAAALYQLRAPAAKVGALIQKFVKKIQGQ
jgi:hypothetical protein